MDENQENVSQDETEADSKPARKLKEKPWQQQTGETYRETAEKLVHFSVKTVNSNASAAGIRLASEDGLRLPYVSARTLMGYGRNLELDYAAGGAAQAGVIKQIMSCERNDPFATEATEQEKKDIRDILPLVRKTRFESGTDSVDLRLRQILIPKESAERGYVAITPVTSASVCHYLFNKIDGLVTTHNEKVKTTDKAVRKQNEAKKKDEPKKSNPYKIIRQARLGIGGSNPQNVGRLTRSMQEPILADAPYRSGDIVRAYAIYHKGILPDFSRTPALRDALQVYADFRLSLIRNGHMKNNMPTKEEEDRIIGQLAQAVLREGRIALSILKRAVDELPKEKRLESSPEEEYELVSRTVSPAIRGLIDPRLRKTDYRNNGEGQSWERDMASLVIALIDETVKTVNHETVRTLLLDKAGKDDFQAQLEDSFR